MNKPKTQMMPLAPLPQKFNWKLYQKVANTSFIKNEETAVIHFRKNAQLDSALRNKYFREQLHIPEDFDEELYIELLKNDYNIKMKSGSVSHEKLYMFYETQGKKKYPLNDTYYKKFYKIPTEFNEELYKSIYMFSNKKNEFYEKLNNTKNIYELYHQCKSEFPLNDDYLKSYFNTPDTLDLEIYKNVYNLSITIPPEIDSNNIEIYKKSQIYKHCSQNTELKNNAIYYKKYYEKHYNISNSFDFKTYIERYKEIASQLQNKSIEEKYKVILRFISQKSLDDKYYHLLHNINKEKSVEKYQKEVIKDENVPKENVIEQLSVDNHDNDVNIETLKILYPRKEDPMEYFLHKKATSKNINSVITNPAKLFIINNLIDVETVKWNNIYTEDFINNIIKVEYIYNLCMHYARKYNSKKIKNFIDYFTILNESKYFKIRVNKEHYILLSLFHREIFNNQISNNNCEDQARGIKIEEKIANDSMQNQLTWLCNMYEPIYNAYLEKDINLEKYKSFQVNNAKPFHIVFYMPTDELYHMYIFIKNLTALYDMKIVPTHITILTHNMCNYDHIIKLPNMNMSYEICENKITKVNSKLKDLEKNNNLVCSSNVIFVNHETPIKKNLLYDLYFHSGVLNYLEVYG